MADRVLIAGTYPPIPRPAAEVTVGAVLDAWAAGYEVTVVSPRLSAAHLAVPIAGPLAGRRLDNVRGHTSARRLVLVAEPGFPVPESGRAAQMATVAGLVPAMRRFDHVTIVKVGRLGLPAAVERRLLAGAHQVLPREPAGAAAGVTALGPSEVLPRDRPRYLAGKAARAAVGLGRRALGQDRRATTLP